jgi:hypothetical protein
MKAIAVFSKVTGTTVTGTTVTGTTVTCTVTFEEQGNYVIIDIQVKRIL